MSAPTTCLIKTTGAGMQRAARCQAGQGHRLRRLLIAQVAHSGCGSRITDNPNWFQASRYSILHSSLSSAESRYHCLMIHKTMSRFENTSVSY